MKIVRKYEFDYEQDVMRIYVPAMLMSCLAAQVGRFLLVAMKVGILEALADAPRTAAEIAEATQLKPASVHATCESLASTPYLKREKDRYHLTELGRLLLSPEHGGAGDLFAGGLVVLDCLSAIDTFVLEDRPVDLSKLTAEQWQRVRGAQWGASRRLSERLRAKLALPKDATRVLDLGGTQLPMLIDLLRERPGLRLVVVDPTPAIEDARARFAAAEVAGRVELLGGDALPSLGEAQFDLVVFPPIFSGVPGTTDALVDRCARALRPGGALLVADYLQGARGQHHAMARLLFELVSEGGARGGEALATAERKAGLDPEPAEELLGGLISLQVARKAGEGVR